MVHGQPAGQRGDHDRPLGIDDLKCSARRVIGIDVWTVEDGLGCFGQRVIGGLDQGIASHDPGAAAGQDHGDGHDDGGGKDQPGPERHDSLST